MICKRCKAEVSILDNTCPSCGHDFTKVDIEKRYTDSPGLSETAGKRSSSSGFTSFKAAESRDIQVDIDCWDRLNWSLVNCGVPFLNSIKISNVSYSDIHNIILRIELAPDYCVPWEKTVQSIPSRQHIEFTNEDINLSIDKKRLRDVNEKEQASLKFEIASDGNTLFADTRPIQVLAYHEWYFHPLFPDILASFIFPNSTAVKEAIKGAGSYLEQLNFGSSLDGYQSGNADKVTAMTHAFYLILQNELQIKYINPPASFEKTGQKILPPEEILDIGRGTCLDLALLYAACLERIGLYPLIFLIPGHAFLGVWRSMGKFYEFWEHDKELYSQKRIDNNEEYMAFLNGRYDRYKNAIEEGFILPINSTTFTSEKNFKECVDQGIFYCSKSFEAVIDVIIARERVAPLPL